MALQLWQEIKPEDCVMSELSVVTESLRGDGIDLGESIERTDTEYRIEPIEP